jgi:hypothetical protein
LLVLAIPKNNSGLVKSEGCCYGGKNGEVGLLKDGAMKFGFSESIRIVKPSVLV